MVKANLGAAQIHFSPDPQESDGDYRNDKAKFGCFNNRSFSFFPTHIFNFLTEVFVPISSFTGVPVHFFPQDFQYSEGEFFGLHNEIYRRPYFLPRF